MGKYIRKFTKCLMCGISIKKGKYCRKHRAKARKIRLANYHRQYYQKVVKLKRKSVTISHTVTGAPSFVLISIPKKHRRKISRITYDGKNINASNNIAIPKKHGRHESR